MISGLPAFALRRPTGLTAVTSCPTDGTDTCIQLRLDAVGYAVNARPNVTCSPRQQQDDRYQSIPDRALSLHSRISTTNYAPLTSTHQRLSTDVRRPSTMPPQTSRRELDTNMNSNLGSGGTHIDTALQQHQRPDQPASVTAAPRPIRCLTSSSSPTAPRINQYKGVPNGGWSGSNHATADCQPGN